MRAKEVAMREEILGNGTIEHLMNPWATTIVLVAGQFIFLRTTAILMQSQN